MILTAPISIQETKVEQAGDSAVEIQSTAHLATCVLETTGVTGNGNGQKN